MNGVLICYVLSGKGLSRKTFAWLELIFDESMCSITNKAKRDDRYTTIVSLVVSLRGFVVFMIYFRSRNFMTTYITAITPAAAK